MDAAGGGDVLEDGDSLERRDLDEGPGEADEREDEEEESECDKERPGRGMVKRAS